MSPRAYYGHIHSETKPRCGLIHMPGGYTQEKNQTIAWLYPSRMDMTSPKKKKWGGYDHSVVVMPIELNKKGWACPPIVDAPTMENKGFWVYPREMDIPSHGYIHFMVMSIGGYIHVMWISPQRLCGYVQLPCCIVDGHIHCQG